MMKRTDGIYKKITGVTAFAAAWLCLPAHALADVNVLEIMENFPCWFCGIFETIYNAAGAFSYDVFMNVRDSSNSLLTVAIALWFAFETLKAVASVSGFDPYEFWKNVGERFFATIVASAFLMSDPVELFNIFFCPVIEGSASFGAALLAGVGEYTGAPCVPSGSGDAVAGNAFSPAAGEALVCLLEEMNKTVAKGMGLGIIMFLESLPSGRTDPLPDFGMMFAGIILILVFFLILLSMPIYLVDAIVRLGFVGGLMPLFVVAWVFKSTRQFSAKGAGMLITSSLTFVAMCVILGMITAMLMGTIDGSGDLSTAIQNGNAEAIAEALGGDTALFPKVVSVAMIGYFMVKKAPDLANHYGQGFGGGAGNMGGLNAVAEQLGPAFDNVVTNSIYKAGAPAVIAGKRAVFGESQGQKEYRVQQKQFKRQQKEEGKLVTLGYMQFNVKNPLRSQAPKNIRNSSLLNRQTDASGRYTDGETVLQNNRIKNKDGSFSYAVTNGETGQVTGMLHTDKDNNPIARDWMDSNGNVNARRLTDERGRTKADLSFKDGKVSEATFHAQGTGEKTTYSYDGRGGVTSRITQDVNGNVADQAALDGNGNVTSYLRSDGSGQLVETGGVNQLSDIVSGVPEDRSQFGLDFYDQNKTQRRLDKFGQKDSLLLD